MSEPAARELMSAKVVSVQDTASFKELARVLNRHKVSGVPVLDPSGSPVGVVSKTDLVRGQWRDLKSRLSGRFRPSSEVCAPFEIERAGRVRDIMSRELVAVEADTPASQVAALMLGKRVHRVLVTEGRKLIGVVSSFDLLRVIAAR